PTGPRSARTGPQSGRVGSSLARAPSLAWPGAGHLRVRAATGNAGRVRESRLSAALGRAGDLLRRRRRVPRRARLARHRADGEGELARLRARAPVGRDARDAPAWRRARRSLSAPAAAHLLRPGA